MAVIKDRNSPTGWQRFFRISMFKLSSDPKTLSVSRSYQNDGSSNAPSHGSIAADDPPRIGKISTARRSHSCALLQSASCSESYAIHPKLSGQTLSECLPMASSLPLQHRNLGTCRWQLGQNV